MKANTTTFTLAGKSRLRTPNNPKASVKFSAHNHSPPPSHTHTHTHTLISVSTHLFFLYLNTPPKASLSCPFSVYSLSKFQKRKKKLCFLCFEIQEGKVSDL